MAQCHALLEIEELGEAITIQLAKNLLLDKSTLSRTVDNLVKRGLVERKQHPTDRRYTTLFLTDKGVRICDEINRANDDTYEKILSELPSNEIQKIMENFEQLVKILNNSNRNANNKNECCNS